MPIISRKGIVLIVAIILLVAAGIGFALTIPRTAVLTWDNGTAGTTWEYRLYENTCHYQGNGITNGTTARPRLELGHVCSLKWVYVQVRAVRDKLFSEWTGDVIK